MIAYIEDIARDHRHVRWHTTRFFATAIDHLHGLAALHQFTRQGLPYRPCAEDHM